MAIFSRPLPIESGPMERVIVARVGSEIRGIQQNYPAGENPEQRSERAIGRPCSRTLGTTV